MVVELRARGLKLEHWGSLRPRDDILTGHSVLTQSPNFPTCRTGLVNCSSCVGLCLPELTITLLAACRSPHQECSNSASGRSQIWWTPLEVTFTATRNGFGNPSMDVWFNFQCFISLKIMIHDCIRSPVLLHSVSNKILYHYFLSTKHCDWKIMSVCLQSMLCKVLQVPFEAETLLHLWNYSIRWSFHTLYIDIVWKNII